MPTSGSTSTPKVIDICYRGLVGNALAFTRRLGLGPENRFYNVLPMTYLGGFYNLLLIPILAEGSLVLDGAFGVPNLYGFWENVKTFGINTLWFTATMLSMLLSLEEDEDLSFLRKQIRIAPVRHGAAAGDGEEAVRRALRLLPLRELCPLGDDLPDHARAGPRLQGRLGGAAAGGHRSADRSTPTGNRCRREKTARSWSARPT